ncbi:hypothetical protein I4F81_009955 [Pyropia yezoensis]|uniref:Uncharacterized protein n=1 Tax=Pyropia yezoensis TaxID=2788 RepID=A0ACC3CC74_PYRYE|nr:hypothetical protein I4F81_009955 [Neopyropia yezoensis]
MVAPPVRAAANATSAVMAAASADDAVAAATAAPLPVSPSHGCPVEALLAAPTVCLPALRQAVFTGCPPHCRAAAYRLLLGLVPAEAARRPAATARRRAEYAAAVALLPPPALSLGGGGSSGGCPGIQRRSHYLATLLGRVDPPLAAHLGTTHGVPFLSFTVRWFGCLLVREFRSLPALLRLWDGLVAEEAGWAHFAVYVVAALLVERRAALLSAADFGGVVRVLLTPVGGGGGALGGVLGRAWVWRESFRGLHERALGV